MKFPGTSKPYFHALFAAHPCICIVSYFVQKMSIKYSSIHPDQMNFLLIFEDVVNRRPVPSTYTQSSAFLCCIFLYVDKIIILAVFWRIGGGCVAVMYTKGRGIKEESNLNYSIFRPLTNASFRCIMQTTISVVNMRIREESFRLPLRERSPRLQGFAGECGMTAARYFRKERRSDDEPDVSQALIDKSSWLVVPCGT